MKVWPLLSLVSVIIVLLLVGQSSAASLTLFTSGLNPYSWFSEISGDGSTVIGYRPTDLVNMSKYRAFMWTAAGGQVDLPILTGTIHSYAYGVSQDGSTIVGCDVINNSQYLTCGFSRTASGGLQQLQNPFPPQGHDIAYAVSGNGNVIVGETDTTRGFQARYAAYWTTANGYVQLNGPSGSPVNHSSASDVSYDGSVIVGTCPTSGPYQTPHAFRWTTATNTMVDIGTLNALPYSYALAVSADGQTTVGVASLNGDISTDNEQAFRWTEQGGMVSLGQLSSDYANSKPTDVSSDGSVIIGNVHANNNSNTVPFIWDVGHGMRFLADAVTQAGINLNGWHLLSAQSISDDGQIIIGAAENSNNTQGALFLLNLRPVPEPSTFFLLGISALSLLAYTWRGRKC
jgi:probable HAF family extracellular repeat protein